MNLVQRRCENSSRQPPFIRFTVTNDYADDGQETYGFSAPLSVFSSESGTCSGFYRRPAATTGLCFSGSSPNKVFRNKRVRLFSGPSPRASLGLGSLTYSRRSAQCAPNRREATQNGVTSTNTNTTQDSGAGCQMTACLFMSRHRLGIALLPI